MPVNRDRARVAFLAGVLALSTPASAQEAESADSASTGIEEIIVTAQKRAQDLQDVPISVSALSSDRLEQIHATDATEIAATIPNVTIMTPFNDTQPVFSIRGVTATDFSHNAASPIGMYVDEVYKGVGALQSLQIFDLDRVEVLRGPQGTLFGRNTTGGAASFFTRQPKLEGVDGYIAGGLGDYGRREVSGALEGSALDDSLGARAAFTYTKSDGYVDNLLPGVGDQSDVNDWALRLIGRWRPTDAFDASLKYSRSRSHPHGYGNLTNNIGPAGVGGTGYDRAGLGFHENESDLRGKINIENQSVSLRAVWDPSDTISVVSVTSWDEGKWLVIEDADATPFNLVHDDYYSEATAIAQDLRVSSAANPQLQWLAGVNIYHEEVDASTIYRYFFDQAGDSDANGQLDCFDTFYVGCRFANENSQTRNAYSAYFDATWEVADRLRLLGGIRFTYDRADFDLYDAFFGYLDPATGQEVIGAQTISISAAPKDRSTEDLWTGRAGVEYEISTEAMTYFTFSRGARSASINGQAFFDPSELTIAKPESVDAYEMGIKSEWFENRLRANGAVFYYSWRNQQVLDTTPTGLFRLTNAEKIENVGVEIELTAAPHDRLDLELGVGYLDAEIKKLTLNGINLAGNSAVAAPPWSVTMVADWRIAETSIGKFSAHFDSKLTDRQYFSPFQDSSVSQSSYWLHNLRWTYSALDDQLEISAWIKNVADEKFTVYQLFIAVMDSNFAQRGRPRSFGFEAKYSF